MKENLLNRPEENQPFIVLRSPEGREGRPINHLSTRDVRSIVADYENRKSKKPARNRGRRWR